ncbi:hypothetical protein [Phaeobacter sp. JH18-37]|uniref:hypothetical protein n=1 Tax=Phaeobacter sp. JH18-37 TaxID=3112458 RepID=UPI003A83F796
MKASEQAIFPPTPLQKWFCAMSRSPSLTKAFEAVARVLDADTGDLNALAEIAGVDRDRLFWKADLTGVDLRNIDIDFLLPLCTRYEGAILTDQQRRKFRDASRTQRDARITKKILDLRAQAVSDFLSWYSSLNQECVSVLGGEILTADLLKELLLDPLVEATTDDPVSAEYTNNALSEIAPWVSSDNINVLRRYFRLLGDLQVPADENSEKLFGLHFFLMLDRDVGILIEELHPTQVFDNFWLSLRGPDLVLDAAKKLGRNRKVDASAIEVNLRGLSWETLLELFVSVPFDCGPDQAERFAAHLTRQNWPARETWKILKANSNSKVRIALFRQILAQGDEHRVAEVIRWLEDERGAAGALSLESAFSHIKSFDLAVRLANEIGPRLAANQLGVINSALYSLANSYEDRTRHQSFRTRFNV